MLFAGLLGPTISDSMFLEFGSMLVPAMEKQGYTRRFAAAITAASLSLDPSFHRLAL